MSRIRWAGFGLASMVAAACGGEMVEGPGDGVETQSAAHTTSTPGRTVWARPAGMKPQVVKALADGNTWLLGMNDGFVEARLVAPTGEDRWRATFGDGILREELSDNNLGLTADERSITFGRFFGPNGESVCGRTDDGSESELVRMSPDGRCLWRYGFGHQDADEGISHPLFALESMDDGSVVVLGGSSYRINFGDVTVGGEESPDFVLRLADDGKVMWHVPLGRGDTRLAVGDRGQTAVLFREFVGDPLWKLIVLDGAGRVVVSRRFATTSTEVDDIAIAPSGRIAVAGMYRGTLRAGSVTLGDSGSGRDGFVLLLDPAGNPIAGRRMGGSSNAIRVRAVSFDHHGQVGVGGEFGPGSLVIGPHTFKSADGNDVFVARFSSLLGTTQYARAFSARPDVDGSVGMLFMNDADFTPTGRLMVGALFLGTVDFGTGPFTSREDTDEGAVVRFLP